MGDGVGWRPGALGRVRALVRRGLSATLGDRAEGRLHAAYHALLRRTGRFGPPEDAATAAVLGTLARRAMTIIDVGANVGRYSWFLRRRAQAQAALYAVEPHPGAARLLRHTLRKLGGCVVLELAASDRDASAELVVPIGSFGSPIPGLSWVRHSHAGGEQSGIRIPLRRLDGLIADGAIQVVHPVFMKIDVEGGEAAVLRGAAEFLRRHRPIVYLECQAVSLARQGEAPEDVWILLEQAGYRLFSYQEGRFVPMQSARPEVVNYFALPDVAADPSSVLETADLAGVIDSWAGRSALNPPASSTSGAGAGGG